MCEGRSANLFDGNDDYHGTHMGQYGIFMRGYRVCLGANVMSSVDQVLVASRGRRTAVAERGKAEIRVTGPGGMRIYPMRRTQILG